MDLESKPCGIARVDTNLFVGTMDQSIQAFNVRVRNEKRIIIHLISL